MAKFEDTPKYKRDARWDPFYQRLVTPDRPPTRKQCEYIKALCGKQGRAYVRPTNRREAASMIDRLKARG